MTDARLAAAGLTMTSATELFGPAGRGRITPVGAGHRLRFEPAGLPRDPIALAERAAALPRPLRLALRGHALMVEGGDTADVLLAALAEMLSPDRVAGPPTIDLEVGVLAVTVPALDAPSFVRFVVPAPESSAARADVDRARAVFVLTANAELRLGRAGWIDGPGLVLDCPAVHQRDQLAAEIRAMHDGLAILAEPAVARGYLAMSGMPHPNTDGPVIPPVPSREEEAS